LRGWTKLPLGDLSGAHADFELGAVLGHDLAPARYGLGLVLLKVGDAAGEKDIALAKAKDPNVEASVAQFRPAD
jgi:hypothetical protein